MSPMSREDDRPVWVICGRSPRYYPNVCLRGLSSRSMEDFSESKSERPLSPGAVIQDGRNTPITGAVNGQKRSSKPASTTHLASRFQSFGGRTRAVSRFLLVLPLASPSASLKPRHRPHDTQLPSLVLRVLRSLGFRKCCTA